MSRLRKSYDKQLSSFNAAKERKLLNLREQAANLNKKKEAIEKHRQKLEKDFDSIQRKNFISFEQYEANSIVQSNVQRGTLSDDLDLLDPETKELVIQMMQEKGYEV